MILKRSFLYVFFCCICTHSAYADNNFLSKVKVCFKEGLNPGNLLNFFDWGQRNNKEKRNAWLALIGLGGTTGCVYAVTKLIKYFRSGSDSKESITKEPSTNNSGSGFWNLFSKKKDDEQDKKRLSDNANQTLKISSSQANAPLQRPLQDPVLDDDKEWQKFNTEYLVNDIDISQIKFNNANDPINHKRFTEIVKEYESLYDNSQVPQNIDALNKIDNIVKQECNNLSNRKKAINNVYYRAATAESNFLTDEGIKQRQREFKDETKKTLEALQQKQASAQENMLNTLVKLAQDHRADFQAAIQKNTIKDFFNTHNCWNDITQSNTETNTLVNSLIDAKQKTELRLLQERKMYLTLWAIDGWIDTSIKINNKYIAPRQQQQFYNQQQKQYQHIN